MSGLPFSPVPAPLYLQKAFDGGGPRKGDFSNVRFRRKSLVFSSAVTGKIHLGSRTSVIMAVWIAQVNEEKSQPSRLFSCFSVVPSADQVTGKLNNSLID
ncbi:hypothetical protein RUM43_005796 [Polyplax serrata]|uniref:Uncharacterized protein n=1 Tax=Polyplax serrata TaxID=468196 RepID=A0AAN8S514_POLSC